MRTARADDYRRRLRERGDKWPVQLERLAVAGVPGLGTAEIPFLSPLTVLSGPNGVGKTTLLRVLWAALSPEAAAPPTIAPRRLSAGSAIVDLRRLNQRVTCTVEFLNGEVRGESTHGCDVSHVDGAAEVSRLSAYFAGFEDVEEITNGVGRREVSGSELETLSYITRRDYRNVALYEVDSERPLPFFEVAHGNDRYDSRTMGAGELAAFSLWWAVERASRNSILLIEEPETFMSPAIQEAFGNYLVSSVVSKEMCAIVTSHSAGIITPLSRESLRFLSRDRSGIKVITDQPPPVLLQSVGIRSRIDAMIFVEDYAAYHFCKAILERFDPIISRRVTVEVRRGEGEIIRALQALHGVKGPMKFVGLFDGDMRGKVPDELMPSSAFLPADRAVEHLFREAVSTGPNHLEKVTGASNLEAILSGLEGLNHHDWFEELSRELGMTKDQLFPILFHIWITADENLDAASACYNRVVELASSDERSGDTVATAVEVWCRRERSP